MIKFFKKRNMHPSIFELLISIPKTLWFNFKILPFKKAIKLPFFISCFVKTKGINRKSFIINYDNVSLFSSRIGIGGTENGLLMKKRGILYIHNNGKIIINGKLNLSRGIFIECDNGTIVFGDNVKMNNACFLKCVLSKIEIGNNTSFGWNCIIQNNDGHYLVQNGIDLKNNGDIYIGNHCWICSYCTILKNAYLGNNCVLGMKSLISSKISSDDNLLYAGSPAKVIKKYINWHI